MIAGVERHEPARQSRCAVRLEIGWLHHIVLTPTHDLARGRGLVCAHEDSLWALFVSELDLGVTLP